MARSPLGSGSRGRGGTPLFQRAAWGPHLGQAAEEVAVGVEDGQLAHGGVGASRLKPRRGLHEARRLGAAIQASVRTLPQKPTRRASFPSPARPPLRCAGPSNAPNCAGPRSPGPLRDLPPPALAAAQAPLELPNVCPSASSRRRVVFLRGCPVRAAQRWRVPRPPSSKPRSIPPLPLPPDASLRAAAPLPSPRPRPSPPPPDPASAPPHRPPSPPPR